MKRNFVETRNPLFSRQDVMDRAPMASPRRLTQEQEEIVREVDALIQKMREK